jgi:hypothetical protein
MKRLVLAVVLCAASAAFSDVIIRDESSCRDKKAGDACRGDLGEGTCRPAKCGRNDYSQGIPPKRKSVDCLKCLALEPADAGAAQPATPDAGVPAAKQKAVKW